MLHLLLLLKYNVTPYQPKLELKDGNEINTRALGTVFLKISREWVDCM